MLGRISFTCVLTGLTVIGLGVAVGAMYVVSDARSVPVERLVKNLENQARERPQDASVRVNLARLHGMAYARDTDTAPVIGEDVWYGFEPKHVPYAADAKPRSAAAIAHLKNAIAWYERALAIDPSNLTARLGLGWSRQQQERKADAIAAYRRVIEEAWPKEQKRDHVPLGLHFYTVEAAGYLIPLLDQTGDASEIAELRARIARLERLPRAITPLAIPLTAAASGEALVDMDASVPFDADGSGRLQRWTWISRDAAWIVYDPSSAKKIDSALQLFGNVTFWLFWRNGFEPLTALDDDRDGGLKGTELKGLALWHDRNADGVSDPGEVRPLDAHGIVEIACAHEPGDGFLTVAVARDGVRFASGRRADLVDVILRRSLRVSD